MLRIDALSCVMRKRAHMQRAGASTSTPVSGGLSTRTGIIIAGVMGGISGLALLWVGICLFSRRAERQPDPPAAPVEPKAPGSYAPPFMEQPLKSTALPLVSHCLLLPFALTCSCKRVCVLVTCVCTML